MAALRDGFFVGFALAFLIGPVFFLLIQTSIEQGFKLAAVLALGVALSDACFIIVAEIGSNLFFTNKALAGYVGYGGGAILIAFGIVNFFKKATKPATLVSSKGAFFKTFVKGFALNSLNPFVLIFWLGVAGSIVGKNYNTGLHFVFYTSIILTVFTTDIFKIYLASKLQKLLTGHVLIWMNRVSGLALIGFGIRIIYKSSML